MKAIHYKPLTSKRSGDKFFCIQCKEPFEMDVVTGLPITPITGCRFHTLRPRKEPGRCMCFLTLLEFTFLKLVVNFQIGIFFMIFSATRIILSLLQ